MYMGADDGCQEVPEPIAPIDVTFFSLAPTRMPMSVPDITISGPMFIELPPDISIPFMSLVAAGRLPAADGGMFIPGVCVWGFCSLVLVSPVCDATAAGGILFSGVWRCGVGLGAGATFAGGAGSAGMTIPGVCRCGEGTGLASASAGATGVVGFIPGISAMSCFWTASVFLTTFFFFRRTVFRLCRAFAFGFG